VLEIVKRETIETNRLMSPSLWLDKVLYDGILVYWAAVALFMQSCTFTGI